uniref:Putative secreted protein n=1 Tax=Xenopsylla cheopis TaxID=163159 RepID=A0A6M2DXU8_XENCH
MLQLQQLPHLLLLVPLPHWIASKVALNMQISSNSNNNNRFNSSIQMDLVLHLLPIISNKDQYLQYQHRRLLLRCTRVMVVQIVRMMNVRILKLHCRSITEFLLLERLVYHHLLVI